MDLNWNDIKYFLALYRNRSFLATAQELKVTHTTVARRITALEEHLLTQLFHRTEKGCRPTREGEQLLPYAEQLESTIINFEGVVSGKDRQLTGSVRVGAPDGIGNCFLAPCLGELHAKHPALEIELIAAPMYHSLSKREVDILITVKKPTRGNIVAKKLTDYGLGLFSSLDYLAKHPPITHLKQLKKHRFIGYIDDLLFDQDLRFMEEVYPGLKANFRSSTVIAQTKAVTAGAGIGVIPFFIANGEKNLVPVLTERHFMRSYWLQVNPDTRQLARVRTTIDHISEKIEKQSDLFLSQPKVPASSFHPAPQKRS